jgi:hypothetical protein
MAFAASSIAYETLRKDGKIDAFPLGHIKANQGDILLIKGSDGYAYPAYSPTSTGDVFAGVAYETVDNSAGNPGDLYVRSSMDGEHVFLIGATTRALAVGKAVYLDETANPNSVTLTAGAHAVVIGYVTDLVSSTQVRVRIAPFVTPAA